MGKIFDSCEAKKPENQKIPKKTKEKKEMDVRCCSVFIVSF